MAPLAPVMPRTSLREKTTTCLLLSLLVDSLVQNARAERHSDPPTGSHGFDGCDRCHASPGRSVRNCTSRVCSTSVTYMVRPSGPPKQRLLGCLPSTSISRSMSPLGETTATVPLP